MEIKENYPLLAHNTFSVEASAKWWVAYDSLADLDKLARDEYFASLPFINLGLGANTLFLANYNGAVLHSQITTVEQVDKKNYPQIELAPNEILFRVGSGYVWDEFVEETTNKGYYGLENLSGIPSSVGSAVVQNIGAYGVEASQHIVAVELFDFTTGKAFEIINRGETCGFGYRKSVFKTARYHRSVITHAVFKLHTNEKNINVSYSALSEAFNGKAPSPQQVREVVLAIRNAKLPNPRYIPNAGSFFQNPILSYTQFQSLQDCYPSIPHWASPEGDNKVKVPAAWLIEQAGYKGKRSGNVGCYEKQPLVIVNYGTRKGSEIAQFAEEVCNAVYEKFGISLVPEVRYLGNCP